MVRLVWFDKELKRHVEEADLQTALGRMFQLSERMAVGEVVAMLVTATDKVDALSSKEVEEAMASR